MNHILLKLIMAPSFVALATLAGRRWGLKVSGWISTFPIVAGPILFFFALEQGNAFASVAALETLMGVISFSFFALVYTWASRYWSWPVCVLLSWVVFLTVSFLVSFLPVPLSWALILALGFLNLVRCFMPVFEKTKSKIIIKASPFDLPFRMTATAGLVLGLTTAAHQLGPNLSGVLTPFPVASTVLVGFAHYHEGERGVARLLSGSLIGMQAFSVFCVALSLTLSSMSIGAAFGLSLLACVAAQWLLTRIPYFNLMK